MTIDNRDLKQRVISIIQSELCLSDVEEGKVVPEARIHEDLGADSLDSVDILMGIEEEFYIDISDEEAEKWITVGDVISYVVERVA